VFSGYSVDLHVFEMILFAIIMTGIILVKSVKFETIWSTDYAIQTAMLYRH